MLEIIKDTMQLSGLGLATLLPLANPITTVAILLGLSSGMTQEQINYEARMTSIYVFIICMIAYYSGQILMNALGISIPGLRIAGGLVVSVIGFTMLFPTQVNHEVVNTTANDLLHSKNSIALVPLAMPGTAGPGTIALIISSASAVKSNPPNVSEIALYLAPPITFFLLSLILWCCLRSYNKIIQVFGRSGIEAVSRCMGFLLVCLGVQLVISGLTELIKSFS